MSDAHTYHTYHIAVYWHNKAEYRTSGSFWATTGSVRHEVAVVGYYFRDCFKVHLASCLTIPLNQLPQELRGLALVVRQQLEALLHCRVIMQSEDTDWHAPPAQGRPRKAPPPIEDAPPLFLFNACATCIGGGRTGSKGTLYLICDKGLPPYWKCINCGRFHPYTALKEAIANEA